MINILNNIFKCKYFKFETKRSEEQKEINVATDCQVQLMNVFLNIVSRIRCLFKFLSKRMRPVVTHRLWWW